MASAKEKVKAKIGEKKVMIISKSYCPFCKKAKAAFKKYLGKELDKGDYGEWEIENAPDCEAIQKELKAITGAGSVPRVFIDGKFYGGGDDTVRKDSSGDLRNKLMSLKG